ncbi:MAG: hypothetical protein MUP92_03850 [Actinobacteria bacterium]|nr:hypothetical protein [Actinomycetota bacterium]
MSQLPAPAPIPPARHSVPLGALLMAIGGAVGIGASSVAWWSISFVLRAESEFDASLGGLPGVATVSGRVTAVASLVALTAAAGSLGTVRFGLRRRLALLAICAAAVIALTSVFMMIQGGQLASDRADLAARAQDMSEAANLAQAAREFSTDARISLDASPTPALIVLTVSGVTIGIGGMLLALDPLGTRRRRSHP